MIIWSLNNVGLYIQDTYSGPKVYLHFSTIKYKLVDIRSGAKPFIKVVLKHKTKMRSCRRTTLINIFNTLIYV